MAGWGVKGYVGRVPCPHCGSTDCAGYDRPASEPGARSICCKTLKPVGGRALVASAKAHNRPQPA